MVAMPRKSKGWRLRELLEEQQRRVELCSQLEAVEGHGEKLVRKAYSWLARGMKAGNPRAIEIYHLAMASNHPYDLLVRSYEQRDAVNNVVKLPRRRSGDA
jgi:TPR repeat protein